MIIKKFQANTETEAILLAKDELGKDAIVMNIKTITPKGLRKLFQKPKVEITAALDEGNKKNTENDKSLGNIAKGIGVNGRSEYSGFDMRVSEDSYYRTSSEVGNMKEIEQNSSIGSLLSSMMAENASVSKEKLANNSSSEKGLLAMENVKMSNNSAIEEKLNNLQVLLEKELIEKKEKYNEPVLMKENKEESTNVSLVQLVYKQLLRNEVDEKYIDQLIGEIESKLSKETTLDSLLANLYQKIVLKLGQPKGIELVENKTKFVYFIGPTGVGKTTTIAKIASSLKLNKNAKIAFLTSDTYRIAAVEQLRIYANILDIPLKVIYTEDDMKDAITEFQGYDCVLIDTAGRSHKSSEQKDNLNVLIHATEEELRETYLVLSATTKYRDLIDITDLYSEITDYRLIFTKLDETLGVGNIYNIKQYTGATLSYTTNGQNVPDDIEKLDAQKTAKKLLGGNE